MNIATMAAPLPPVQTVPDSVVWWPAPTLFCVVEDDPHLGHRHVEGTFDGPGARSLGTASGEHWFVSRWYADNLVAYWNDTPFSAWNLRVEQHRTFEEYLADVSPKHIPPTLMERLRSTSAHRYSRVMWWVRKVAAHWRDWVPIALSAATLATVLLS